MGLFTLLDDLKKHDAIERYLNVLGTLLARMFGSQIIYTPKQVRLGVRAASLPIDYLACAIAIFSTEGEYNAFYGQIETGAGYIDLRTEVAKLHFSGKVAFSARDIAALRVDQVDSFVVSVPECDASSAA